MGNLRRAGLVSLVVWLALFLATASLRQSGPISAYEPRVLELVSTNPTVLEYYLNRPYTNPTLIVWCDGNLFEERSLEKQATNAYVEVNSVGSCYAGVFSGKNGNHVPELLTNLIWWYA